MGSLIYFQTREISAKWPSQPEEEEPVLITFMVRPLQSMTNLSARIIVPCLILSQTIV